MAATYIESVKAYAEHLASTPGALETLVALFNQRGHEYFGTHRSPFQDIRMDLVRESLKKKNDGTPIFEVLNLAQFIQTILKEGGYLDNESNAPEEVAFDDSYRHSILLDISDMDAPKLVDPPDDLLSARTDWVFHWAAIQKLPARYPDGKTIAVHMDTVDGGVIYFPVPTVTEGGRRKKLRRRKTTRKRKTLRKKST